MSRPQGDPRVRPGHPKVLRRPTAKIITRPIKARGRARAPRQLVHSDPQCSGGTTQPITRPCSRWFDEGHGDQRPVLELNQDDQCRQATEHVRATGSFEQLARKGPALVDQPQPHTGVRRCAVEEQNKPRATPAHIDSVTATASKSGKKGGIEADSGARQMILHSPPRRNRRARAVQNPNDYDRPSRYDARGAIPEVLESMVPSPESMQYARECTTRSRTNGGSRPPLYTATSSSSKSAQPAAGSHTCTCCRHSAVLTSPRSKTCIVHVSARQGEDAQKLFDPKAPHRLTSTQRPL